MPAPHKDWELAFWSYVREGPGGCWIWTGSTQGKYGQYGQFGSRSKGCRKGRTTLAHRIAYEIVVGVIRAGMTLDHLCRRPRCVNPAHLEPVTSGENVRRGWPATKTHCVRGHPLVGNNLYLHPKTGRRGCRTCRIEQARRSNERRRLAG